ncbi:hypothetical protein YGS_C1P0775 [Sphingobium sp. YG1]|nr:hypothetical protein YGS_C1P0775 [Sphingobium sp. YG1]
MAHFTGQELIAFFGLLAPSNIKKNAEHGSSDDTGILALSTRRYPAHLILDEDSKVGLIRSKDRTCCSERSADAVAVCGMNVG